MVICNKELCTGCGLCSDVCPHGAVTIEKDEYGFLHPIIGERCVECGLCRDRCPVNSKGGRRAAKVYAAYAKDGGVRRNSSSGGVFRLLADMTLEKGGVVAAVGYDDAFHAVYKISDDAGVIDEMMGSKYTEASSDGVYSKVKKLLSEGVRVFFTGTPCRVAALKNLVGDDECLLTADLICHGVPPQTLLEKYLAENFDDVRGVSFRDKTLGWQEFSMSVKTGDGAHRVTSLYKDPYLRTFLCNTALRESCYDCRFKGEGYRADITLGDFWGISSCIPAMNDDRGTSAVVIRSEKGFSAFDEIKDRLIFRESSEKDLSEHNVALFGSSEKPAGRAGMLEMLKEDAPFSAIAEKYGRPVPGRKIFAEHVKRTAKKVLGKISK